MGSCDNSGHDVPGQRYKNALTQDMDHNMRTENRFTCSRKVFDDIPNAVGWTQSTGDNCFVMEANDRWERVYYDINDRDRESCIMGNPFQIIPNLKFALSFHKNSQIWNSILQNFCG